jgi:hypothetical protein
MEERLSQNWLAVPERARAKTGGGSRPGKNE